MFKKPIVIVVGAGASYDTYKLPLGSTLATSIAEATSFYWEHGWSPPTRGDADLYQSVILGKFGQDRDAVNRCVAAGQRLSAAIGSTVSIDDALYQLSDQPEAVELGKVCIVRAILKAESVCELKISPQTLQPEWDAVKRLD